MAKQKGIIKLEGTIGDISFYKSRNSYIAREKTSISADRIAKDPAFQRTRENGSEFGRAGKAGKLLRTAMRTLLISIPNQNMVGRITREMMKVIHADATSTRGQRNVIDGEVELLQGFEFNEQGKFLNTFFAPYVADINRSAGTLSINIPTFSVKEMIIAPAGATHARMSSAGVAIDFENEMHEVSVVYSDDIPLSSDKAGPLALSHNISANSTHPLFLAVGIEFSQFVNGIKYPLNNGAYNALVLAKVDGGD